MNQLATHNVNTRGNTSPLSVEHKCYCLHPRTIMNPKVVDFALDTRILFGAFIGDENGTVIRRLQIPPRFKGDSMRVYRNKVSYYLYKNAYKCDALYLYDEYGVAIEMTMQVPCGHCTLCREQKRKHVAAMCQMECQQHQTLPLFTTLTFADKYLPEDGVDPRDVQLFMKRLRISLKRKYKVDVNLRTAYCGEYGKQTKRPHYHILIWGFPYEKFRWNFLKIDRFIRACWHQGLTYTEPCTNCNCGQYIAKYMTKDSPEPKGKNKCFVRHSANLGVFFWMDTVEPVLGEQRDYNQPIYYKDCHTGELGIIPMTKYYITKLYPKLSSLPIDFRNAVRDLYMLTNEFDISDYLDQYKINMDIYAKNMELPSFADVDLADFDPDTVESKLETDVAIISRYCNLRIPDYKMCRVNREHYYNGLFQKIGDIPLADLAYCIEKNNKLKENREIL